ncbi:hypothetical protein KDL44_08280 [bacterium]|nr:hypothetical protein [bacterium]
MDPNGLIAPVNELGYPAPFWFLIFFRVLGFTLHLLPMNLWYAGTITAMLLGLSRVPEARRFSARLMSQMPFIIAFGVNLGIVPLLFLQVMGYRVFYSATILMAWQWLSVIALLCLAYYGVYIYAVGLRTVGMDALARWQRASGWLSALLFIVIAVIFHSAMLTMAEPGSWPALAEQSGRAAAVYGTAHALGNTALWTRMLFFLGLAMTTTAAYVAFDGAVLAGRESSEYRSWTRGFAPKFYTFAVLVYAGGGLLYAAGWEPGLREYMSSGSLLPLNLLTVLGPGLPLLILWLGRNVPAAGLWALIAQFLALGLQAVSRQLMQNQQLAPYLDIAADPLKMQIGPLAMFLVSFVAGLGVLGWIIARLVEANRKGVVSGE